MYFLFDGLVIIFWNIIRIIVYKKNYLKVDKLLLRNIEYGEGYEIRFYRLEKRNIKYKKFIIFKNIKMFIIVVNELKNSLLKI